MELELSVRTAIIASGVFLWIGMLAGVWKYLQIRKSEYARAHYYVDITHRSSLMYASACLILAVLAYFSAWSALTNFILILGNLIFFAGAVISYIIHGMLQDTSNQLKHPHQMGSVNLPSILINGFMWSLIVAEVGCTMMLLIGAIKTLLF